MKVNIIIYQMLYYFQSIHFRITNDNKRTNCMKYISDGDSNVDLTWP